MRICVKRGLPYFYRYMGVFMRIGVVTFYWAQDNYGQLLQAYALQRYLREAGHEAFVIRYRRDYDYIRPPFLLRACKALNPVKLYNYLAGRWRQRRAEQDLAAHPRGFDEFRARYLQFSPREYSSWTELQADPPEADAYIVGSDQMWNFGGEQAELRRVRRLVHANFLDFGAAEVHRLSYAASWSVQSLRPELIEEIRPLLAKFDYVSVREKKGVELCAQCGRPDAEWVPDPTFLLEPERYRELYRAEHVQVPQRPYLLLYMLANGYSFPVEKAYEWAEAHGMDVVFVTGNSELTSKAAYLTIPEWLGYVDGAAAVLTNSFHCAVFATQFRRPFGVVPLTGPNAGMNSRMEALFQLTGQPERYVRTPQDLTWLEQATEPEYSFDKGQFARVLAGLADQKNVEADKA